MFIRPHTTYTVRRGKEEVEITDVPASIAIEDRQYAVADGVAEIDDADWPALEHRGWEQCDPPQPAAKPARAPKGAKPDDEKQPE